MEEICGGTKPYLSAGHLESEHLRIMDKALHQFDTKRKMGGKEFSKNYRAKLEKVSIKLKGVRYNLREILAIFIQKLG